MTAEAEHRRPLEGVRVVEFCFAVAGPMTCQIMAHYGAEAIKVESEARPDIMRRTGPYKGNVPHLDRGSRFPQHNGSVLSVALNIGDPRGVELARRLAAKADVVVENLAPGALQKLGLAYHDLIKVRPDLIMLSLSIFGQVGPNAAMPGFGTDLAALAGFTDLTGWPDRGPALPQGAYTDYIIPPLAVCAILEALEHREATGQGRYIDLGEYETALWFLLPSLLDSCANDRGQMRAGNRVARGAPHRVFRCRGRERWCTIAIYNDAEWRTLCMLMDRGDLAEDPRFATVTARLAHEGELGEAIEAWTAERMPHEIMDLLQSHGLEAGAVQNGEDLHADAQLAHRGHFHVLNHPAMGHSFYQSLPTRLSAVEADVRPAPCLGEHTYDVCRRVIGLADEEIVQLIAENVLY